MALIGCSKPPEQGRFSTLYIESLSRLARESILTMPILKRLVYRYGIRIVVLDEGIDTANEGWDLIASILAQHHERYVKDLGKQVFRGQEGAILDDYGVGDYCLGFTSEPIPGSEQGRRGRNAKPRTAVRDRSGNVPMGQADLPLVRH